MKKNNGFTLVEILAVIVIIALIMTVVVPNALKASDSIKAKSYETKKKNIVSAAILYGEDKNFVSDEGCIEIWEYEGVKQVRYLEEKPSDKCYEFNMVKVSELADSKYIKYDETKKNSEDVLEQQVVSPYDESMNDHYVFIYKKNNRIYGVYRENSVDIADCVGDHCNSNECTSGNCNSNECTSGNCNSSECTSGNCSSNIPLENDEKDNLCEGDSCMPTPSPNEVLIYEECPNDGTVVLNSSSDTTYIFKCSGLYEITYAGAAGGRGGGYNAGNNNWTSGSRGYPGYVQRFTMSFEYSQYLQFQAGVKGGDASGIYRGANGRLYSSGGSDGYNDNGMVLAGGGGGGGGASRIDIYTTESQLAYYDTARGGNGADGDSYGTAYNYRGLGGYGGTLKTVSPIPQSKVGENYGSGYITIKLVQSYNRGGFVLKENCPKENSVVFHRNGIGAFRAYCAGKYLVEYAGSVGGISTRTYVGGVNNIDPSKPSSGDAYQATVEMKLGQVLSVVAGTVGDDPDSGNGGTGGYPGGENGENGYYTDSRVMIAAGGGGGGGYTFVSLDADPILSANGGKGATGGSIEGYSGGTGGNGGVFPYSLDTAKYNVKKISGNNGIGYIKVTYLSK